MSPDGERRARVALSFLAKPGDPVLGAALRRRAAAELLALVTGADADGKVVLACEYRGSSAEQGRPTLAGPARRDPGHRQAGPPGMTAGCG